MGRKSKEAALEELTIESGENAIANKEVEGLTQWQIIRRRFFKHKAAVASLIFLTFIIVFVFSAVDANFGPIKTKGWWKWSPDDLPELRFGDCPNDTIGCPTISLVPKFLGGEGIGLGEHPFGQDDIGRDYFSLVMKGTQRSIQVMFIIGFFAAIIGTVVGAVAGYYRGIVDNVLMRFTDF
ncbi:MAG: ABC transporter permease, partial [Actinobacteria bacterium]|nr:ABC transporter permease [Actinomycetota bacterium]